MKKLMILGYILIILVGSVRMLEESEWTGEGGASLSDRTRDVEEFMNWGTPTTVDNRRERRNDRRLLKRRPLHA